MTSQQNTNTLNAEFWDELCGTALAKSIGITENSVDSLEKFDNEYMGMYPYLYKYLDPKFLTDKKVLEVGMGYGTMGQYIASRCGQYHGLDIAANPVKMMNYRLERLGLEQLAIQGNMLECPYPDNYFDTVYSIGCFHHTGDIQKCFDEAFRVLKPEGYGIFMVYNQYGLRNWTQHFVATLKFFLAELGIFKKDKRLDITRRAGYDANAKKEAAPETILSSKHELRKMLSNFKSVEICNENIDAYIKLPVLRSRPFPKEKYLSTIGRVIGIDLYIVCQK
ncbi:MAG: hypothetical protein K0R73_1125 [Candidatus Midichloriaceae bacterium]|jgi:ubiquinone/menaquinone biosynthesis C-methylase UbiE|nr:hypothetical protein [Candidatus Midichloriaceae bacterium]